MHMYQYVLARNPEQPHDFRITYAPMVLVIEHQWNLGRTIKALYELYQSLN